MKLAIVIPTYNEADTISSLIKELFEKVKHRKFPGGRLFRMPLLVTISAMQRMADIFNV